MTRDSLEVQEVELDLDGKKVETLWKVYRGLESTFPGEFARRIHREVVERIISDLPRPVRNPIRIGSLSDICKMLDINTSGKNFKNIRSALLSIVSTNIRSTRTFYSKARKSYIDAAFHLYEMVIFAGETLPDGNQADAVHVGLASWYLENLNANYVIPLDFEYYRNIKGAIASRMYELLHHWFFVAMKYNQQTIERRYSTLCAYFPLTRQPTLWEARRQLREAHKQHHETGFLGALPEWNQVHDTPDDWTLIYEAGPKARDEFRRNQNRRKDHEAISPDEEPATLHLLSASESTSALFDVRRDLARELSLRGISEPIANDLVHSYEPDAIQAKLEAFDWLIEKQDKVLIQNPPGYLRASIEKNYAPPAGFVSREERTRKAAEEAAQFQARKEAEAKAQQDEQAKRSNLQARWAALTEEAQLALRERALATLPDFARRLLQNEERDGRRGAGHATLEAEIHKLLEAEPPGAGEP